MSTVPAPASTAEALDMILAGLGYLAAADPTALASQAQAECLQTLEQADAIATAARARILAVFTAGQGYSADADYSPTSWLIHCTGITKGAARGHLGWAHRAATHSAVVAALAAEIYARSLPDSEDDPGPSFEDRQLRVETTFAGAGVIAGDLTPQCAAVVTAVLEALSAGGRAGRSDPGPALP